MDVKNKLKSYIITSATCGGIGHYAGGGLVAVLVTVPFQLVSQGISWLFPTYWYVVPLLFVLGCGVVIQLALWMIDDEEECAAIVLNRSAGFMVALGGMAFSLSQWKMVVGSIFLFHLLATLRVVFDSNKFFHTIDSLPGALGIMTYDVLIGIFVRLVTGIGLYFVG